MSVALKVIFVFIDGLGLRAPAADNPVNPAVCPVLCNLIDNHAIAIDANLDVAGLPQSATGQTTLYTGVNASQYMGRHCEGFPGPSLRKVIEEDNIFKELTRKGLRCRFADAYPVDSVDEIRNRRFKSVTTVMALTQPETISTQEDLLANQAVFHDITRSTLQGKGYAIPPVTPPQAADHLFQLALGYDFTLFEFFVTDLAGHSGKYETACDTLATLDQFLEPLVKMCQASDISLIVTSDHGNIENMGVRGHTRNPIPFISVGKSAHEIQAHIRSLVDVTPRLTRLMVPTHAATIRRVPSPRT